MSVEMLVQRNKCKYRAIQELTFGWGLLLSHCRKMGDLRQQNQFRHTLISHARLIYMSNRFPDRLHLAYSIPTPRVGFDQLTDTIYSDPTPSLDKDSGVAKELSELLEILLS